MIKTKTVFILGAGASYPYGYPTGQGLRSLICKESLNTIYVEDKFYRDEIYGDIREIAKKFENSGNESIDLFLARNEEDAYIGKILITAQILDAEMKSYFNERIPENKINQDWYKYLFGRMTRELTHPDSYQDFSKNNVSFVTFNYDRSLEYYLFNALNNSFSKATKFEIAQQVNEIPIFHVYGKLADLEFENGNSKLSYQSTSSRIFNFNNYKEFSKNIRVIYDRTNHEIDEMKKLIENAERVFFLGFGFAPENLEAIGVPDVLGKEKDIWGTAYGMIPEEIRRIRYKIGSDFSVHPSNVTAISPIIEDTDVVTLLRRYLEN